MFSERVRRSSQTAAGRPASRRTTSGIAIHPRDRVSAEELLFMEPCPPLFLEGDALDDFYLLLALEVDEPQRTAVRPVTQMHPGSPAYAYAAGPGDALDAGGRVHDVAPDVELELRLAHD